MILQWDDSLAILLDTNFYLGLVHPKDPNASRSAEILELLSEGTYGLLYTTNYVIAETSTLVAVRTKNNATAFNNLQDLFWGNKSIAKVLFSDEELVSKTWTLFKKINKPNFKKFKIVSFVDTNQIITAQSHNIEYIVSVDDHFDNFLTRIS